ncbi:MAG: cation-translocating P-type ATPase [Oscillospiraceae bacterium]|nr:cation-translocating P-type ATPase [Oscillospiraceae bacterium]
MKYYCETAEKALVETGSGLTGLGGAEAAKRLEERGKNKLTEGKHDSAARRFLKQLADPMIIILIVAAVVSGITSVYANESMADVFIILFVVIVNAVLGVYQESKAEKAIEALREMTSATSKVLRDGRIALVKSEDLVVGDVVLLEAGDSVPADGRIIESASLQIEEAALTGESVPVNKLIDALELRDGADVPLGDRRNMAYMGSAATYGRGRVVITATGMETEMGKIADAIAKAEDGQTPLQKRLSQLSKILSIIVIGVCAVIFAVGLIRGGVSGESLLNTFMVAVSLAVAAIPEGLVAVVTIVLSIGVTNMSRRRAIIRKLTAVETLGCAQIICSDKTGTLTQNKMTVVETYGENTQHLAIAMALCTDSDFSAEGVVTGEPTENALVEWANKVGFNKEELKRGAPRVGEAPFDSGRKMMSVIVNPEGEYDQFTKGAPDNVLRFCTSYEDGGEIRPMDDAARERILAANKSMADRALRVLAAASRRHNAEPTDCAPDALERDMRFIGLVGMSDPVRPEVRDAIDECRTAGIRAIMITGDHVDTASAIARELGILGEDDVAVTGAELEAMDDEEFAKRFRNISVYARVQPEHKVRIVTAWRDSGHVTAMTGDGVNDAPSIKTADIGIGMGITGTDVTKNVADMVLADDNFATIVGAVEEGRRIYDNIRRVILFLFSSNMSEVLGVFAASLLGFTLLHPVHLLWINLVTDCFPALALGLERAEQGIMARKARDPNDGVFADGLGFSAAYQGVMVAVLTMASYFIGHFMQSGAFALTDSMIGTTMAFLTMSMAEIFHSFNVRSLRGSLFTMGHHNKALNLAAVGSFLLTTAVIFVPPLARVFEFEAISLAQYAVALGLAVCVIPIVELVKLAQRKFGRGSK